MADRHRVGSVEDFAGEGSRVIADVGGMEIAVFRAEGDFHAVGNYCVHQGGPLCEGDLRGRYGIGEDGWEWTFDPVKKNVVCPWHGWKFDVTTGKNINDERYAAPTYDVEVDDGVVYIVR
jgi:nitrite reductase/ring-hydroxylating ferredoxin subunit